MRKKIFVTVILLAAVLLSGCRVVSAWPGLSVHDDVAYLANTTAVYAVNVKTGEELWKFTVSGGFMGSTPSFVTTPIMTEDGLLIVLDSGNKHIIYALNSKDINEQKKQPGIAWQYSGARGHWIAMPLIVDNRLFAPNSDGNVYVLDLKDGKSEKKAIEVIKLSASNKQPDRLWAQPVTDGKRLYVASLDHRIFAIDLETYKVVWQKQLDAAIPSAPAIGADGMLYVGSLTKQLERFDPVTGEHTSVYETHDWVWSTPLVDGDNLYFGDVAGNFYSYNTKEGKLDWEMKLDGAITAVPLILGDRLLVATESGDIYAVLKDGSDYTKWYHPDNKGKAYTTPILAGDYVLAAYTESDYYLVALNSDGDLKWTFNGK